MGSMLSRLRGLATQCESVTCDSVSFCDDANVKMLADTRSLVEVRPVMSKIQQHILVRNATPEDKLRFG